MKIVHEGIIYLIFSKDGKLVAKGTPRNRCICHIDEGDDKRFLTYSSEGRAKSGFQRHGFRLSDRTIEYILKEYPELKNEYGHVWWSNIEDLFEVRKCKLVIEQYDS